MSMPKIWTGIILIQGLMILLLMHIMEVWASLSFTFIFIVLAILFATNFLILYLYNNFSEIYEEKLNAALQAKEKAYYLTQLELMQQSTEQMKAFKHDIQNHLAVLQSYVTSASDQDNILNYLEQLLGKVGKSDLYSDTGHIAIDSIINYKLLSAEQAHIKLDIKVLIPMDIQIEAMDLVTILGNLLDNALEAIAKVNDKWIKLDIEFNRGSLFINIENTFDGMVVYDDEKQVTTLKDGDGHGYGLENVAQSINHYDGEMKITHTDAVFSVVVLLYVDAS